MCRRGPQKSLFFAFGLGAGSPERPENARDAASSADEFVGMVMTVENGDMDLSFDMIISFK